MSKRITILLLAASVVCVGTVGHASDPPSPVPKIEYKKAEAPVILVAVPAVAIVADALHCGAIVVPELLLTKSNFVFTGVPEGKIYDPSDQRSRLKDPLLNQRNYNPVFHSRSWRPNKYIHYLPAWQKTKDRPSSGNKSPQLIRPQKLE